LADAMVFSYTARSLSTTAEAAAGSRAATPATLGDAGGPVLWCMPRSQTGARHAAGATITEHGMTARRLILWCLLVLAAPGAGRAAGYDYPFADPYAATAIGTPSIYQADLPENVSLEEHELTIFPDRQIPDIFWYTAGLRFGFLPQHHKAPLAFVIGGTGADYDSSKNLVLIRMFQKIGFHVISVPSPIHQNFIVNASTTSVPGLITQDAQDLYRVMRLAYAQIKDRIEVSGFDLIGYSLGGAQAAFVAKVDDQQKAFGFQRVLLVNPPVNLATSAHILDALLDDNTPQGIGNFVNQVIDTFLGAAVQQEALSFTPDLLYAIYRRREPKEESLAAAIGLVFRVTSADMIFTSDVMTGAGYITPPATPLGITDSLTPFAEVALRTSFDDYIDHLFLPFYQRLEPGVTREQLIYRTSLRSIDDYLASAKKIGLMHNQDDITLAKGDIEYLKKLFGDRAKIYPKGGHVGNLEYRVNVADIIDFFTK
jgi:pimeloyl-ACP methyl ester carboxylesterase